MQPIEFPEQTIDLGRPSNMTEEECSSLPVRQAGGICISKWKLTGEELTEVLQNGYIWIAVWSGESQPAICPVVSVDVPEF